MTKTNFNLANLVIIIFLSSFICINDWVLVQNDNYKILFPSSPKHDTTKTETKIGPVTVYLHMHENPESSDDSNLVYGLVETEYPAKYFLSNDEAFLKGFFNGSVNGVVEKVNGKLISEKDIVTNKYPGKEIKVDYGNGMAIVTMRLILAKTKMYGLQTIALTGKENNANALKFFNSFEIK